MPTYTYKCNKCDHQFEQRQKISDDPLKSCPECKDETLRKIIAGGGNFSLKGKGWFKSGGY